MAVEVGVVEEKTVGVGKVAALFLLTHPTNVVETKSNNTINAIFFIS